jgi:hypothetical protein
MTMALTELVLDDSYIGKTIGPANGFLVDLVQTGRTTKSTTPCYNDTKQHWVSSYCQLRGSKDIRDIFCLNPSQSPAPPLSTSKRHTHVVNDSIPYLGDLIVKCLPAGSTWEIALSDVELTWREKNERAKAKQRKELEAAVAALQRKADKLAPAGPSEPLLIDARAPVPVMAEADKPKIRR